MKLQHNYTTKEQALRLKAAGVPAETADCMLTCSKADYGTDALVTLISDKGEAGENWDYFMDEDMFPCWSLGRLIELATYLLEKNNISKGLVLTLKMEHSTHMVEDMVRWFERCVLRNDFQSLLPDRKPEPKKEKLVETVAVRYFGSECPLDPKKEVDQYNCVECDCYFATASKSIICKKTDK